MKASKKQAVSVTVEVVQSTVTETLYLVKDSGVVCGFISKSPDTSTDEFPWKAFEAITGQGSVRVKPGSMKAFFGSRGKEDAIEYLRRFK